MPTRSDKPGFKRGRHGLPYWIARQVVRDIRGFPDRCVALPPGADDDQVGELCRGHAARLKAYLDRAEVGGNRGGDAVLVAGYDGTVAAAIRLYRDHTMSPFNEVARNTRKTYNDSLKVIENTVGLRLIRNVTLVDVKRWYREWRKGIVIRQDDGSEKTGPERIDRAHDAVQMTRAVLRFGRGLGFKDCAGALERIGKEGFAKGAGREQEMTYPQAFAFVRAALDLGGRGVLPADRALHMAIGVAAQFEMGLRQRDVIGKWAPAKLETPHATYDGAGEMWIGPFRWDNIPGWKFRLRTSKNKSPAGFLLTDYPLLFPLLEQVPHTARFGAIVKGEGGMPVRERSYRKWYRQIAEVAGIPKEVWSMDARAGAATEAEEAGVDTTLIQGLLTHRTMEMTEHYIRRLERGNRVVAKARAEHRRTRASGDDRT